MNKTLNKLLATILFTAMLIGTMPMIMPAKALPTQGYYILPTTVGFNTGTTSVGFKFNVTVWIVTTVNTFSWQAMVKYNTTQIMADRADYTGSGKSLWFTGHPSITAVGTGIWNGTDPGNVTLGEVLSGTDFQPPSSGSLFWIEFEIMSAPTPGNTLSSSIYFDAVNSFALDDFLVTEPGFVNEPCAYSYAWAPPPNPHPEVINFTTNTFHEFGFWNGTTFDESLYIKSLSAGWFLTNATADFTYNGTLLVVTNVVYNPLFTGLNSILLNVTGHLQLFVQAPSSNPSNDVIIANVTMMILTQGSVPPRLYGAHDDSVRALSLTLYSSFTTVGLIPVNPQPATLPIVVKAYLFVLPPWLSVSSPTLGPGPVLGQLFNVTVSINNVVSAVHHLIGVQYRLQFNHTLIQAVAAYEGPYFPYWGALEGTGTFFFSSIEDPDGLWGPHVIMANMVYPNNMTGVWNDPLPDGSGVLAIVTFQVVYQSFGEANITSPLTIADQLAVGLDNMVDQNLVDVSLMDPINGMYTITTNLPKRMIDEYGGAVNSGMIQLVGAPYLQFQAPYGGQGPNAPMDLVEPQSWVWLHANVTYNYWPVQFKLVAFEIQMPNGTVYNKLSAFTDENGVATVGFRMPWPCDINTTSSSLIGVWTETSTVQLADVIITDTLSWHYDYLVHVWKVTTPMFQYNHGQCVQITFDYGSHAQQTYPVLFVVSIVDELGVTVGIATVTTTFGGTVFCQYKNQTVTVEICIPKWAYAGIATIHVNTFNWEPSQGGVAIAPEFVGPTIAIQPY